MLNMIKADLFRMRKSKGLYIFFAVIAIIYVIPLLSKKPGGINLGSPISFDENTKLDIQMMAYNFSWYFLMIIPVFMIVTADFGEKTIKNTISSAISRKKYFIVKYAFAELFNIGFFVFTNILFWLLNSVKNGTEYSTGFSAYIKVVMLQLPVIAAISGVFVLLTFILKRTAAYNAVTIVTPLAYTMVALILYEIKSTRSLAEKTVLKIELGSVLNKIAVNDDHEFVAGSMLAGAVILALSFMVGYLLFTRKEID